MIPKGNSTTKEAIVRNKTVLHVAAVIVTISLFLIGGRAIIEASGVVGVPAQQTADKIKNKIITQYLSTESPDDPYAPYAYLFPNPISGGQVLTIGQMITSTSVILTDGDYLVWIDDDPGAGFEHSSRIIITRVNGDDVDIVGEYQTYMPVTLDGQLIWFDIEERLTSPDLFFPTHTLADLVDYKYQVYLPLVLKSTGVQVSVKKEVSSAGYLFPTCVTSDGMHGLVVSGFSEEAPTEPTKEEYQDIFDEMGIDEDDQHTADFSSSQEGALQTPDQLETAIGNAAQGGGDTFVLAISTHGYLVDPADPSQCGGIALCNKEGGGYELVSYPELLCMVCRKVPESTNSILIIIEACHAGHAIDVLNDLDCADCSGKTIGIAAACAANESSYLSHHVAGLGRPWDFPEEMEDEDWDGEDVFGSAQEAIQGAAGDLDGENANRQHPVWGQRSIP
jgi:hypothetical protein